MKQIISIIILVFFCAFHSFAATPYSAAWQKGNDFYKQKQYDSALYYYEQIAELKPQDAVVYYNLANTYYRLSNVPYAVLNYERALRLNPDYKEAKENLQVTQNRIANAIKPSSDIFFVSWWHALTMPERSATWAVISLFLFVSIIALQLLKRFRKGSVSLPSQLTGLFIFLMVIFLLCAFVSAKNKTDDSGAVVLLNDTPLMNSELKGKPLSLVPQGTTVDIRDTKGDWLEVRLPDGRTGWMQQSGLIKI